MTRLETVRLAIRTFDEADAESWLELVNDPEVDRFLPPSEPLTAKTSRRCSRHVTKRNATSATACGPSTRAAIAAVAHAFGPGGVERVMAVVVPENVGSWRVMEKAGMRQVGLVDYYGLTGLKKYEADRDSWQLPVTTGE